MSSTLGDHAVVIGASIAGLATAAMLADHFVRVTLLERDRIDAATRERRAVPQGHHLHTLLRGGQEALAAIYPELIQRLRAVGAAHFRVGLEGVIHCPAGAFYNFGCTVQEPFDFGCELHNQSRGLLEQCIRHLTLARPNVALITGVSVDALRGDRQRITGVQVHEEGGARTLGADLVIDAGGRGSQVPRWLQALGASAPTETSIEVDFAYASTKFRIPAGYAEPYRMMAFHGPAPRHVMAAALLEIEDRTWQVSAAGRFAHKPPADADGFMRFIASLPSPKLFALIKDAERVAEIKRYRFPRSVRRNYDRLRDFPEGLLVIGDALCSVNPVYGQGMSTAAMEARALGAMLAERAAGGQGLTGLATPYFGVAARLIDTPWSLAATADFAYPQTSGRRPRLMGLRRRYLDALNQLAAEDGGVNRLMTEVFHLSEPIELLSSGSVRRRALARMVVSGFRSKSASH